METEFYKVKPFSDLREFITEANSCQMFFNVARKNSGKEYKTPWEVALDEKPRADSPLPRPAGSENVGLSRSPNCV